MKYRYRDLKARCERITAMRLNRARKLCKEAGLDPTLLGIHPHNAMVSLHYGKPWPEVNYSKCRACIRVLNMPSPEAILTRLYLRLGYESFDWD